MITVVLDDDPTGTQAMADVPVLLDWRDAEAWEAVHPGDRAVHLLTNSRAYDSAEAAQLVSSAAAAAQDRFGGGARFLLRGDSTLRAHVWEEYEALRSVIVPARQDVPLLLVLALPDAGRVTIGGVHLLEREGGRVSLDLTEYATDGDFAYTSAILGRWAEERSGGRLAAADATSVALDRIRRTGGAESIASALAAAAKLGRPAVVVPDAENEMDLRAIADGLNVAEAHNTRVIVRSAPAFVKTLTKVKATISPAPSCSDAGILILCGSFVSTSTSQIERLEQAYGDVIVTASVAGLAGDDWKAEVGRLARAARSRIEDGGLVAVVTERARNMSLVDTASQRRIATALAQVARSVIAGVVIAKGGITSAITARVGMGARSARVVGAISPGVALWRLPDGRDYIVVPGNVGGPNLLVDLVTAIVRPSAAAPARPC